jgi:antitoxin (DNA-binding transcriptional repressor) of toxin-antitoxin stability system
LPQGNDETQDCELKDNLSRCFDPVRAGGAVLVLDRECPVAEIVPLRQRVSAGFMRLTGRELEH